MSVAVISNSRPLKGYRNLLEALFDAPEKRLLRVDRLAEECNVKAYYGLNAISPAVTIVDGEDAYDFSTLRQAEGWLRWRRRNNATETGRLDRG